MDGKEEKTCNESCIANNRSTEMTCKLTTPELRERKETVIASLKQQMKNGTLKTATRSDSLGQMMCWMS